MGTGASKQTVGVPTNPRVQYSKGLGKREKKTVLMDAPVLVDIEHGSVRYRESMRKTKERKLAKKELPFERESSEKDLDKKDHYFYHARLNEYGPEASKEKEDQFKFYYVMKGPASAHRKKIFYVYGQGWDAVDGRRVKPSETIGVGKDYAWSSSLDPNAFYYSVTFDHNVDPSTEALTEEEKLLADLQPSPNKASINLTLTLGERVSCIKARVAVKLLKDVKNIHVVFDGRELRDEDIVGDLRKSPEQSDEELPENFPITLTLVH